MTEVLEGLEADAPAARLELAGAAVRLEAAGVVLEPQLAASQVLEELAELVRAGYRVWLDGALLLGPSAA